MEDIIIVMDEDLSNYISDIGENESTRVANELARIENEKIRNEYFEQVLKDKKSYYKKYRVLYTTTKSSESTFAIPSEYNSTCILDVYVNGFYLNESEYTISGNKVVLTKPLDIIGSSVEIVVLRAVGIAEGDLDDLRKDLSYDDTEIKESITNIETEQVTQNTRLDTLETEIGEVQGGGVAIESLTDEELEEIFI